MCCSPSTPGSSKNLHVQTDSRPDPGPGGQGWTPLLFPGLCLSGLCSDPAVQMFAGQRVALVTMAMYGLWWIFCRTSSAQGPCVPAGDLLLLPILECAGQDISCWFDATTGDVLRCVDPRSGCIRFCTPRGRFLHIPPEDPRSDWDMDIGEPWWRDPRLEVGLLTSKSRWIRIINTLTSQEQLLEVCSEETLEEILQRYLRYNAHACSYTWKFDGAILDMKKTLSENGLPDEDLELDQLRLDRDAFVPAVLLHFNDDLTEG